MNRIISRRPVTGRTVWYNHWFLRLGEFIQANMNDNDFLEVIEAEPANPVPRLVYADWLDDQGDPRGELLRIQEELRHLNVPKRAEKEARMHELLREGVEPLVITRTNSIGMELVLIFPGEFVMGTPAGEEGPLDNAAQMKTTISHAFWLGRSPVTLGVGVLSQITPNRIDDQQPARRHLSITSSRCSA